MKLLALVIGTLFTAWLITEFVMMYRRTKNREWGENP